MISYEERSKKIRELERELSYSESEHKMLDKTYEEALSRGNYDGAEAILNECLGKARHILELQKEISKLYDFKVTDTQPEPKKVQESNIERYTRNNLFIVNFLDMPYDMIKSVESFDNEISLQLYDFVYDDGTPVIQQLYEIMRNGDFDIEIQRLNNLNEPIYIEEYRDCCINNISRSCLDYGSDESSTISLNIIFKDLTFRKPGIPKRKRTKNTSYESSITQED